MSTKSQTRKHIDDMRAKGFTKRKPFHAAGMEELKQRILRIDGAYVKLPEPEDEPELGILLERGQAFDETAFMYEGQPLRCHINSAVLATVTSGLQFATGYALTGGQWVQHSWCVIEYTDGTYQVLETTCHRVRYYCVVLTDDELVAFEKAQNQPELQWSFNDYADKLGFDLDKIIDAA